MNRRHVAILIVLLLLAPAGSTAQSSGNTTDTADFTITFGPGMRKGRPTVEGYVYNKRPYPATRLRLRVDSLDGSGAVVSSEVRQMDRDINANDRAYFQVPLPALAPAYRVTVDYVFWRPGGGGV